MLNKTVGSVPWGKNNDDIQANQRCHLDCTQKAWNETVWQRLNPIKSWQSRNANLSPVSGPFNPLMTVIQTLSLGLGYLTWIFLCPDADSVSLSRRGIEDKLVEEYRNCQFFKQTKAELGKYKKVSVLGSKLLLKCAAVSNNNIFKILDTKEQRKSYI